MAAAKRNEPSTVRFTTKELSKRTFADFERFFSQVHGCMCTLYSLGGHIPPPARTAKELAEQLGPPDRSKKRFPLQEWTRQQESKAMRELVWQGQAHGILVYADGEPVGWCQFGHVEDPPVDDADDAAAWWRINCFTTRMDYRRQGVATRALAAAVSAIRKRGGGWIEASPMTFPHNDPMLRKLRKTFGWRSPELTDYIRMNWAGRSRA